jgi:hypothetical protein
MSGDRHRCEDGRVTPRFVPLTPAEQSILDWMRQERRPVLYSEIEAKLGLAPALEIHELSRLGFIKATFPESKPGDSGRQFWVTSDDAASPGFDCQSETIHD